MRILVVHPVMEFLGGGERLCCETIRALSVGGHEIAMLSQSFDPTKIENFFGYESLFEKVTLLLYPSKDLAGELGKASHLTHHLRSQVRTLRRMGYSRNDSFDLVFSTQEPGYIPDVKLPVIQWGYFPRVFPRSFAEHSLRARARTMRYLPLRMFYDRKISRIGLVLAISLYSKSHLDKEWKRPSTLVYPACNMVSSGSKHNLVVTVARAIPQKRLELFWNVARLRPQYEFVMLLTQDPQYANYFTLLSKQSPSNGRTILNPPKETYHKFLGKARVYLHLMEREHFGITIVEAMSASCVPIVHDSGGPREIVEDGTGFRWRNIEDVPGMIDEAMKVAPSAVAMKRAQDFSTQRFESTLSSIFSKLQ